MTAWMPQPIPKWLLFGHEQRQEWVMESLGIRFCHFFGNPDWWKLSLVIKTIMNGNSYSGSNFRNYVIMYSCKINDLYVLELKYIWQTHLCSFCFVYCNFGVHLFRTMNWIGERHWRRDWQRKKRNYRQRKRRRSFFNHNFSRNISFPCLYVDISSRT